MKWEELPLADRAQLMAAAVRNGYTDIRSIKAAYANFQNQRQQTGNRYDEGGDIDNDDIEVVNVLDEHPVWKALENIDYTAVPDPEFTKEKTGQGDIEWFDELRPDGVTYRNGYHRDHPIPGTNVVLYNPNTNNEQDIKLDALHGMYKDPTYDTLNQLYREAAKDGDVMYNAKKAYEEDLKESNPEDLDPFEQYFNNEADALLRNMFIEGTPEYIKSKRYHPYKQELRQWNAHLMPYIDNIQNYLETGERPAWINIDDYQQSRLLPELTVTNQNAYGGNLFKTGGNKGKKSKASSSQNSTLNYIAQQLEKRGVPKADALAVAANIMVESKGNPEAVNPISGAKGLVQYLGSRKKKVKSWAMDGQLDQIAATYNKLGGDEWLDKNAWKRFNETTDVAEKARLFRRYWERPEKSSWNDTDKYLGKHSNLPQEVNDLVAQVSSLQYNEPKAPVFTLADQRLLETSPLVTSDPDYSDPKDNTFINPYYEAVKLDSSLDRESSPLDQYFMLTGLMNSAQQDDNSSWFDTLMTYSPKVTPKQKEAAGIYRLFNTSGEGGQLYHGLNFAAYGGKVNRFGLGDKMYNITASSDQTAQVAGLPMIQRQIAVKTNTVKQNARRRAIDPRLKPQDRQQAARLYTNIRTSEMQKAAEENNVPYNPNFAELSLSDEFRREQELLARELQEQQGTISAPAVNIQAPLHTLGTQPGLDAAYTRYANNPTQYNQNGYLGGVAATGKADRALGSNMLAGMLGMKFMPFAPETTMGKLAGEIAGMEATARILDEGSEAVNGKDIGENVRSGLEFALGYNPETWNPYAQGIYNFTTDLANPGYWGTSRWLGKGINAADNAARYAANDVANSWRTMRYQLAHPESQTFGIVPENIKFTFNNENPFALENSEAADFYKKMQQQEYFDFLRTGKLSDNPYSTLKYSDPQSHGYSQTGLNKDVIDHLVHDTLGRRKIAHQKLSDADRAYYQMNTLEHDMDNIANVEDALKNIKVNVYDESIWKNAGMGEFDGMHFSSFGEEPTSIAVKRNTSTTADDLYAIQRHEGDHEIDDLIELTPEQKKAVKNAYDQDFTGLPERLPEDDALHGYENMDAERTTTNSDARDVLLGHHKGKTDIALQNKIIDKSSDEKIFAAVEKANGYGRRYIQWLREHGKLTPKKAQQFREAMKVVAIGGITVGTIGTAGNSHALGGSLISKVTTNPLTLQE